MKTLNVGVVGYSAKKFDKKLAKAFLEKAFEMLKGDKKLRIVSGLTYIGIPAIAYDIAKEEGFETVGVACSKAKEYECFKVDEEVIVGDEWGDESDKFLSMIDVMVKVGGGKQSEKERDIAKDKGIPVIEFDLPLQD